MSPNLPATERVPPAAPDLGPLSVSVLLRALDAIPTPLVIKDADDRVVFGNPALFAVFGRTREEFLNRRLAEVFPPEVLRQFEEQEARARETGQPQTIQARMPHATGDDVIFSCTKTPAADPAGRCFLIGVLQDVTAERRFEEAERERGLEFVAQVLDTVADPIFVKDEQHRWIVLNRAVCELIGRPREELLGRTDRDVFPREEADVFWAKDELVLRTGEVNENEEYLTDSRGERHTILTKKIAFTDSAGRKVLVGVSRDITERRRAEQALRESEERFRAIFNQGPLGMATLDLDLRFRRVNEMLCRMLGREEADLVGRKLPDLTLPEDRSRGDDTAEHLLRGSIAYQKSERRLLKRGGGVLWASLTLSVITDQEGEPLHFLAMVEDVSDRKRAEVELLEARDAAVESTRTKSRFLANVSHEIRTPLNAVIGLTGLLLEGQLTQDQRECIELIRSSGEALLTLLNDILDFSKLENDRMELERRPFALLECLEESLDLVAPRASEKGLELTYVVGNDVPARIVGDSTRLRQVLVNLLSNAVKFTASGEVRLEVSARPGPEGHAISFAVLDTGIGIPSDRLDRLFQSFSQADASTTRQYGGTGLGLAISRRLVELMGGRIGVESAVGRGSTFHFTIVARAAEPLAAPSASDRHAAFVDRRLLIIDDTASVRAFLAEQAARWGMSVQATGSVDEALTWVRAAPFDAVLVDRDIPGVHAADVARALRAARPDAAPAIVLLSPRGPAADVGRALRAARPDAAPAIVLLSPMGRAASDRLHGVFQGQLTKPVKLGHLRTVLAGLLVSRAGATSSEPRRAVDTDLGRRAPLRVLVVDDNVVNQKVAVRILDRMSYRGDVAGSGAEALAALRRQRYDVVLLDLHMPEMDGLETARRIRGLDGGPRPYLIAVTADVMHGDRERCLAAGMDDFVGKPVRIEELQAALVRCAALRAPGAPAGAPEARDGPEPLDDATVRGLRFLSPDGSDRAAGELYGVFLVDAEPTLRDLRAAVARKDAPAVVRLAHGLRGSCANLGARLMLRVVAALEQEARAGRLEDAPAQLEDLRCALDRTREAARARFGEYLGALPDGPTG